MVQSLSVDVVKDFYRQLLSKGRLVIKLKNQKEFQKTDFQDQLNSLARLHGMDYFRSSRKK